MFRGDRPIREASCRVSNFSEFNTVGYTCSDKSPVSGHNRVKSGPSFVHVQRAPVTENLRNESSVRNKW